ncbi:hypothetical protein BD324DRAFT_624286 [Kockovaella imperatae]|uniref:Metallo-dependent hydrolase n=1 Tax=Kockovaella imperatae TaxID=4999 RepID=A0A1Y1UJ17_9TREE|nr:hypothetical protein BD324DRAFT_624286 [Kockovaella imperatae]ORX38041.1 hypothetical protein BD324DRAFT_624286 [Kockovaella imperatae]
MRFWYLTKATRLSTHKAIRSLRMSSSSQNQPSRQTPTPTPTQTPDHDPPNWMTLKLPPAHILSHLTDAHCHPTDLDQPASAYDATSLGAVAAMATEPENQPKVRSVALARPWKKGDTKPSSSGSRIIACFGYHPWFSHRYTLQSPPPSKEEHYTSLFFPQHDSSTPPPTKKGQLLGLLLPFLPDPIEFGPLISQLSSDIRDSVSAGNLTMLGEVGLDGGARLRWPTSARHLHPDAETDDREGDNWNVLTPFKTSMAHQIAILERQFEVAIQHGVNVSLHSVAAAGPTFDTLVKMRDRHRNRFTNRINVDIHSGGGFSPDHWKQTERNLLNVYASPSIFVTSRSSHAAELIRTISKDRMLVESDSHDLTLCTRAVWGATEWIARCRGWKLEDENTPAWTLDEVIAKEEQEEQEGARTEERDEVWAVRTLERNFARFMNMAE